MRPHYCGRLGAIFSGTVTLAGWAHRRRDHGGVIFIDLRGREGRTGGGDPDRKETFATAEKIATKTCSRYRRRRRRPEGTVNPNIASGEVEVLAHGIEISTPRSRRAFPARRRRPLETVRLTHRVIDLPASRCRRTEAALRVGWRCAITSTRTVSRHRDADAHALHARGRARHLVPRGARGRVLRAPQSPQLFKQMLMIAGYDRYYQITKVLPRRGSAPTAAGVHSDRTARPSFLGETEIPCDLRRA